jgi:hypothetical protein
VGYETASLGDRTSMFEDSVVSSSSTAEISEKFPLKDNGIKLPRNVGNRAVLFCYLDP